jgi:hypothetical protein
VAGDPTYIELGVPDVPAARQFYGSLFDWEITEMPGGGSAKTGTLDIGIHGGDKNAHFEVFFAVADLDQSMSKVVELGGETVSDVHDNEGFGRWVECRDDQGVLFGLREPAKG